MKFIDGAAVPYLTVASIIALGYAGIKSQRELRLPDFTGLDSPSALSEQERQALGITQRMPLSWEEGRNNLYTSKPLRQALGSKFVDKYLAINHVCLISI
jgi:glutamine synthetase